jgi:2-polyprenyl-3-methyl-5-hydroxy-6-metoxy-1,4-benzoquinol methylase
MQDNEWFKNWFNSTYYHILYNNRNENEAEAFMQKLVGYLNVKPNSYILDVACGKGRHSKALSDMGFFVSGIDLSTESIEQASALANDNLEFFVHDMRLPFRVNYYNYAFNLFTSFGYFNSNREHQNAIRAIANSIVNEGILVIDYLNVAYEENLLINYHEKQIDAYTFEITKWHTKQHFFKKVQVVCENELPQHLSTERVAKFSVSDFEAMLLKQNMQIVKVFGDYNLNDYNEKTSSRMIIIAKKVVPIFDRELT